MSARYHVAVGRRSGPQRREDASLAQWLKAIQEAQKTRADLDVSIAVDGIALVASRSVEDADHTVSVSRDRRVTRCSCWQWRRRRICPHACHVAIRLWEEDQGMDLSQVGARALLSTIVNRYIAPPPKKAAGWWLSPSDGPETRIA